MRKLIKNVKLLHKCFKEGFFSSHKQDLMALSIIGVVFIVNWFLFGIFGYIQKCNIFLTIFHSGAVIVGTVGIMAVVYFLKNIDKLEREFNEKVVLRRKLRKVIDKLGEEVDKSESFSSQVTYMADNLTGLGVWIKDEQNRYIFADKTLRDKLYDGIALEDLVGKTDSELQIGKKCFLELPEDLKEEDIPNLDIDDTECSICNVTDELTKTLKRPCRFYEFIVDKFYDVWKTPLMNDNNEVTGSVGALADINDIIDTRGVGLKKLLDMNEAFRINGTPHYYVRRYNFAKRCDYCPYNSNLGVENIKNNV